MSLELYCYVAALRDVQGLPPVGMDHPDVAEASLDPRVQRLAAAIKRNVAAAPPLTAEQIEQLRGLLPYPGGSADREAVA